MKPYIYLTIILAISGCKLIQKLPDVPVIPSTTTTTTTIPGELAGFSWKGANYSSAVFDPNCILRSVKMDNDKIYYDMTIPADWKISGQEPNLVQAIGCFGYEENGKKFIGKYEWIRVGGQTVKLTDNIHHGYGGLKFPAYGSPAYTMLVDVDGKRRSNLIKIDWK